MWSFDPLWQGHSDFATTAQLTVLTPRQNYLVLIAVAIPAEQDARQMKTYVSEPYPLIV
ncbi:hypothetical protein LHL20_06895 [Alteromonas sp. McT4-15]|uniref:hypothetical protein n=1 Tax=Alteromonas sp. McT4-15 TaxID=2881256 RepID=UPI0012E43287|nr:hypothetical protein [Alteromonas sp. McT4-15]MCB4435973.1 hypothetical protein [Alteromonas sp. McT4-15]GFD87855.1 hypothetical protein KUL152_00810 [Tenacibaculum sp. KUL152]